MLDPSSAPTPDAPRPPTSTLAVVAFVMALVPCCFPVTMLGAMLGWVALRRIRASGGMLGGAKFAASAIPVGIILTILSLVMVAEVTTWQRSQYESELESTVEAFLVDVAGGDLAAVRARLSTTVEVSDDDLLAFGDQLQLRFGHPTSIDTLRFDISQWPTDLGGNAAFIVEFAEATVTCGTTFHIVIVPGKWVPTFRIVQLELTDGERGPLVLPVAPRPATDEEMTE
jgi:hypothetical protein